MLIVLVVAISLVQVGSLAQLLRSSTMRRPTRVGIGSILAMLGDMIGPLVLLWRLPKWADMPWNGLLLYVPDVSRVIVGVLGVSIVKSMIRVFFWLSKGKQEKEVL